MARHPHLALQRVPRRPHNGDTSTSDPVRMYLKDIAKAPLLTPSQETDLAMRTAGGVAAAALLACTAPSGVLEPRRFREIVDAVISVKDRQLDPSNDLVQEGMGLETVERAHRPKNARAGRAFLRRVERDGRAAQARLIVANLRLVVFIAKRYVGRGMLLLDLVQEGNLGLIRATERFDQSKGFKFSTYATWWIRQGVTRGIADQARTIRMPVHITEMVGTARRTQRQLVQDLGREPEAGEIGDQMGVPAATILDLRRVTSTPLSLDTPVGQNDDSRLAEFIEDETAIVPPNAAISVLLKEHMAAVLETLTPRERRVIQLRFGLIDDHPSTLDEVGREFDLTRERIRQIEALALSKLRHPSSMQMLHEFLE